jgi:hypothetical protein
MLEEATVDVASVVAITFGDNVTEPYGTHLLELAVADGTGKVSEGGLDVGECRRCDESIFCCFLRCTCAVRTRTVAFARALLTAVSGSPMRLLCSLKHSR